MRSRTLVLACLLLACGRKAAPPKPNVAARPTDGGAAIAPGRGTGSVAGGTVPATRDLDGAAVHVPEGLGPNEKAPLIVLLHGFGATSQAIVKYSQWLDFTKRERIAWVAPNGPKDTTGRRFWNAGSSCCDFDAREEDHVAAFRALVTRATAEHPIDSKRVYFVGYSNGGFMAHRIACELGDLVAGVVSVAGAGRKPEEACPATAPVRVLQVHGDEDAIVVIGGGPLFRDPKYPTHLSAEQTVADWAKRYVCKSEPVDVPSLIDFDDRVSGSETKIRRFDGCKRGAVELWTVRGGDHYIGMRAPALDAMWKFLSGGF